MKKIVTRTVESEIDVREIKIDAMLRHAAEDMPPGYPHLVGETWSVIVDVDTGQIRDWPAGVAPHDLHTKVCDGGTYALLDADGVEIAKRENEYVPSGLPGDHFGDYIIFNIDGTGRITNWDAAKFERRLGQFFADDE